MILDELTEFADATTVVGAVGTNVIGDQIDLGITARDVGNGEPLYAVIGVATGINAAGAGTLTFQVVSADDAALTTNVNVHIATAAIVTSTTSGNAGGTLAAGTSALAVALPMEGVVYRRYLGIRAVVAGNNISAGAIDAFLTPDVAKWKSYDAPFQL